MSMQLLPLGGRCPLLSEFDSIQDGGSHRPVRREPYSECFHIVARTSFQGRVECRGQTAYYGVVCIFPRTFGQICNRPGRTWIGTGVLELHEFNTGCCFNRIAPIVESAINTFPLVGVTVSRLIL